MNVTDYAKARGISVQRVAQLARAGKIPARKVGGQWVIEGEQLLQLSRRPLSKASQFDMVMFLARKTLDHVEGYRRQRLAERVRTLKTSENRAALLREWFVGSELELRAGAALVIAAQAGEDERVNQILRFLDQRPRYLSTPETVASAFRDARMIAGLTFAEVSASSGVDASECRRLERNGVVHGGNISARKVERALGFRASKLIVKEPIDA